MVAKRNLSPRLSLDVPKTLRRSQGQYRRDEVVGINSPSNHSTSRNNRDNLLPMISALDGANNYSQAVADNVLRKKEQFCRAKATESIIVIAVNLALSLAAITAIARLLPYQSSQKDRLDEITTEVNSAEQRVNGLREKLPQNFNSGKSQEILQRKQGWIKDNQITIKLLDPPQIASPNNDGIIPTTTTTAQRSNQRHNR
jgi:hypothetical protein